MSFIFFNYKIYNVILKKKKKFQSKKANDNDVFFPI
jgi:hypothetical protein